MPDSFFFAHRARGQGASFAAWLSRARGTGTPEPLPLAHGLCTCVGAKVIERVLDALRECAVLTGAQVPVFDVLLSGQAVCKVWLPDSDRFVIAKVTAPAALGQAQELLGLDLKIEHQALVRANGALAGRVPEVIHLYAKAQWQVLITAGIDHVRVTSSELANPDQGVCDNLIAYFDDSFAGLRDGSFHAISHRQTIQGLIQEFAGYPCVSARRFWLAGRGAEILDALPHVPQHGDFVVNNIGCNSAGLVFFDWEDFGAVTLPGLDLATLVFSSLGNEVGRIAAFAADPSRSALYPVFHAACRLYSLTEQDFCNLLPFYAAIFLRLKRSRSPAIRRAITDVLSGLR